MSLNAPRWLIGQPIAHRGFHDFSRGIVENTLSAADAAIARRLAIECDVQLSADGEAMVYHDATLDRLTDAQGPFSSQTVDQLKAARFKRGDDRIPTFQEFLDRVAGRTPVICEIKSAFDGDLRLADRVARLAAGYGGPLALKSFDPDVLAHYRAGNRPGPSANPCPLGIVAEARYDDASWDDLGVDQKVRLANFLHYEQTMPDFISYCVDDLPNAAPFLLRTLEATPVMAWTVRTSAQQARAAQWADQIVFEGDLSA